MNGMSGRRAALLAVVATMLCGTARAAVPSILNFSGRLGNSSGDFTGTAYLTLTMYSHPTSSAAGAVLWTDTLDTYVEAGRFHVLLGADPGNPLPANLYGGDLYVGVQVGSDPEMTPRIRVASVPFALRAEDSQTVAGKGPDAFATTSHGHALSSLQGTLAETQLPSSVVLAPALAAALAGKADAGHNHDAAYVNEGQAGAIDSAMVKDGTLQARDLADWGCAGGQVVKWTSGSGWGCGNDLDAGKTYTGADFAVSGQACLGTDKVAGIDASGHVLCAPDSGAGGSTYTAGTGLVLTGSAFSVDQAVVTAWIRATCYDTAAELAAALPAWDQDASNDLTTTTDFWGDVDGTYDVIHVTGIQSRPVLSSAPADGDTLVFQGGQGGWAPVRLTASDGVTRSGNHFMADFGGTGTAATVARSDHGHAGAYVPVVPRSAPVANAVNVLARNVGGTGPNLQTTVLVAGDGLPLVLFVDAPGNRLKLIRCGDLQCATLLSEITITTFGYSGGYAAMALGRDGFPVIAWYDSGYGYLARCADVACMVIPGISDVDAATNVGPYQMSVAVDLGGIPMVTYHDDNRDDLKMARCNSPYCGVLNAATLDDGGANAVGFNTSVGLGPDGLPVVAYSDRTAGTLKIARCTSGNCAAASAVAIIAVGGGGATPILSFGNDGLPIVAYGDSLDNSRSVIHCGTAGCAGGNGFSELRGGPGQNAFSGITVPPDGLPLVSWYDAGMKTLRLAKCRDAACQQVTETLPDSTDLDSGSGASVTTGPDGLPVLAFYASATGAAPYDLRYVHCSNPFCQDGWVRR